jgi:16S rRNA (guanine527-N7)-methyltransferase
MSEGLNDSAAPAAELCMALATRGITLDEEQIALLDAYARRLWDWNTRLNLTRHTDYERFVGRDVVDSWALSELLETGERVLDVGTGGGVPGVVIAILRPDVEVAICDSIGKKARAAQAIVQSLGLPVAVHHARVQDVLEAETFDTLVARAVGPLARVLQWLRPHEGRYHRVLLVKGPKWIEERREAKEQGMLRGMSLRRIASYPLEGTQSESVILEVRSKAEAE